MSELFLFMAVDGLHLLFGRFGIGWTFFFWILGGCIQVQRHGTRI